MRGSQGSNKQLQQSALTPSWLALLLEKQSAFACSLKGSKIQQEYHLWNAGPMTSARQFSGVVEQPAQRGCGVTGLRSANSQLESQEELHSLTFNILLHALL